MDEWKTAFRHLKQALMQYINEICAYFLGVGAGVFIMSMLAKEAGIALVFSWWDVIGMSIVALIFIFFFLVFGMIIGIVLCVSTVAGVRAIVTKIPNLKSWYNKRMFTPKGTHHMDAE